MNNQVSNPKMQKKSNLGLIIIVISLFLIIIGIFLWFTSGNNKENKDNNEVVEEKVETIDINEKIVQDTYNKYHSKDNPVKLSKRAPETTVYSSIVFESSSFDESLPYEYADKIIENAIEKIKDSHVNNDLENTIYEQIEKEYKLFMGNDAKYKKELFQCYTISSDGNDIVYSNSCDEYTPAVGEYKITKAEKDSKNLYIYEDVVVKDTLAKSEDKYTYKWTYKLQNDKNYYLIKAEQVK
jgi:hypothetical protein